MRGIYAVIVLSLASTPVLAQGGSWYVGGGITGTNLELSGLDLPLGGGEVIGSGDISDTAFGGQIFVGVMFNDNFGLELKYNNSGDAEATISVLDPVSLLIIPVDLEFSIYGFTLYGVGTLPFSDKWGGSLKLGYTVQDDQITASAVGFSASNFNIAPYFGVAVAGLVRYSFNDKWAVTGELEYIGVDFGGDFEEPLRYGLNVAYQF